MLLGPFVPLCHIRQEERRLEISIRLREAVDLAGADFFGVADLTPVRNAILEQGGPTLARFPRGVSVGINLPHAIVDELPNAVPNHAVAVGYRRAYDTLNMRLDILASHIGGIIQRAGYDAFPVPASGPAGLKNMQAVFSHKLAAHLAGLGWIGKNCMLITPEVGPRVRWVTVLTDAPLDPTGAPMDPRCGSCTACVDACPPQAFTGEPFRPDEPREVRFDAEKCAKHLKSMEQSIGLRVCGLCISACPHGRSRRGRVLE